MNARERLIKTLRDALRRLESTSDDDDTPRTRIKMARYAHSHEVVEHVMPDTSYFERVARDDWQAVVRGESNEPEVDHEWPNSDS